MRNGIQRLVFAVAGFLAFTHCAFAAQENLELQVNNAGETLQFDWPILRIGTGEYPDGPTGVTVFHFQRKVLGAIDARGGGPGTVNSDFLRLGYAVPEVDTVVFSGGSWYGLETATAVGTALKDDGLRDGTWVGIALSVGSIIYDLGDRRLNEIYPDKRLAQAAFRAARPGVFPLGAYGAGRSARSGGLFGCNAYSGQGGAYRQIGEVKIAVFTVVNALGVVTTRDGRVAACYPGAKWPQPLRATDLLAGYPASRKADWAGQLADDAKRNTTISLVVVNQALDPAELNRLAVQVHTSMGRALQPFATEFDGDVLYAVSTEEMGTNAEDPARMSLVDLGVVASELMWDAVLASVPKQPAPAVSQTRSKISAADLDRHVGDYRFSEFVSVRISKSNGKLFAQASGARDAFAIGRKDPVELQPVSATQFMVPGRYPLTVQFDGDRLVFNPGHWSQTGVRQRQ